MEGGGGVEKSEEQKGLGDVRRDELDLTVGGVNKLNAFCSTLFCSTMFALF